MLSIYKFPLKGTHNYLQIPKDAKILTANQQEKKICIWALLNTDNELEEREIVAWSTGSMMPSGLLFNLHYINTVFVDDLVWHVFEVIKP